MSADEQLARLAEDVGLLSEFKDMQGVVHVATPETQRALIEAEGLTARSAAQVAEARAALLNEKRCMALPRDTVVCAGQPASLNVKVPLEWTLLSENEEDILASGQADERLDLPSLSSGVYPLHLKTAKGIQEATVLAAPKRTPQLNEVGRAEKNWGVMAALYGVHSSANQSFGSYKDLAALAEVVGREGAGFLGLNPVHALGWAAGDVISPYSPTHRGFLNADHIAPMDGTTDSSQIDGALIDYKKHRQWQRPCLEAEFEAFVAAKGSSDNSGFVSFCAGAGLPLDEFARFEALSMRLGSDCRTWHQDAPSAAVPANELAFHKWLQWRADEQLAEAQTKAKASGMPLGLYLDLAVGARLGGAESWGPHSAAAENVSLGAPPDHLSPAGQMWQLAPLSSRKLKSSRYQALRFVLARTMRHCSILRIDHALGLNRSFWIPENGIPGGYMRQPFESLTAVIAIEAERAGTVIIGEDLGLVPKGFREAMAAKGFYGYSVLQYEKDPMGNFLKPEKIRAQSLACFGTHDTPTLAGFWQGKDIAWWRKLGWIDDKTAAQATDRRASEKRDLAGIPAPASLPGLATAGVRDTIHAKLAATPAAMVAVQLDDVLGVEEAQNLPGTTDAHPNWRRRAPRSVPELTQHQTLKKTAQLMAKTGRAPKA
ncbi:MAG: 4-alpha-glucanotransferase [Pseudomonadota bacterium]